jgi:hypothetical protein
MPVKNWEFDLEGARHKVVLDHSLFMGQLSVRVNGGLLFSGLQPKGGRHPFRIGEHICEVVVEPRGDTFAYNFLIDGVPNAPETLAHQPGEAQAQMELMRWLVPLVILALGIGGLFLNIHLSHNNGYFYRTLSVLTPPGILLGLYMLVFPKEFIGRHSGISGRLLVVMFIGFVIGFYNLFALANGLY